MSADLKAGPSVGDLLTTLARNTGTLVQQEVQLAATEMTAKARGAARDLGMIAAGGALVHIGVLAILAAVVVGMSPLIPIWLSSLVLGVMATVVGYVVLRKRVDSLGRLNPIPKETVQTLKDDKLWVKEQFR
jgi:Putative Actinobacterial Holin-X, holin superfamily III